MLAFRTKGMQRLLRGAKVVPYTNWHTRSGNPHGAPMPRKY